VMDSVWIVDDGDYYSSPVAVFSSEELAKAYVAQNLGAEITEWVVNQYGSEVRTRFCAKCNTATGEVTIGEAIQAASHPGEEGYSVANSKYCVGYSYDSQEHANLLAIRKRDAVMSERGKARKLRQTAKQDEYKRLKEECDMIAREGRKFWVRKVTDHGFVFGDPKLGLDQSKYHRELPPTTL